MQNDGGDPGGFYAEPFNDHTNYLAVVPNPTGSTTNVALGGTFLRLRTLLGVDRYLQHDRFLRTGHFSPISSVTGQDAANAVPGAANGCQQSNLCNAYIIISAIGDGLGFDILQALSTSNSFEVDNLAWDIRTGGGPGAYASSGCASTICLRTWRARFLRLLAQEETDFEDGNGLTLSIQTEL